MPGVNTQVQIRTGPAADALAPSSSLFAVGLTERGPSDVAARVTSFDEFVRIYGPRVSYGSLHDAVQAFFEEGGTRAFIGRVVGPAATAGTLVLKDNSTAPGINTITINAKGAGAWSSGVTVQVLAGTITGTFRIDIVYNGVTESYDNFLTPAQAVARINRDSKWVTAVDNGSVTAAPNNQPKVIAATALSAGNDQRGSLVANDYTNAVNALFGVDLGAGVVIVPGFTSAQIGTALAAHCAANRRIGYVATAAGQTVAQAISAAQALRGTTGGEKVGLLYPWVLIDDGVGGTRTVSPEGFVAGKRAKAHELIGPWRTPAGSFAASNGFVKGVEKALTKAEAASLDAAQVSAIRVIAGRVEPYGYRSLSSDPDNWWFLNYADLTNHIEVEGEKALEQFVFETVDSDSHLLGFVEAAMRGLVGPIRKAGGLYSLHDEAGADIDKGWSIDVGASVNPTSQLALGRVAVNVVVRPSPTGADITLTIIKAALTAAV
jgi:hypothetical protein